MGCACCHRFRRCRSPRPLRLCSLHHSKQFPGFLSRLFPCFIIFPSSLLLPSLSPRFGAGYGLYGVLWWKRGRASWLSCAGSLEGRSATVRRGLMVRLNGVLGMKRTAGRTDGRYRSVSWADGFPGSQLTDLLKFARVQSAALDDFSR